MVKEHKVFIVDDDPSVRDTMRMMLEHAGFDVHAFSTAQDFLDDAEPKIGCAILDIRLPDMNGLELQEELARDHQDLQIVVLTGHADITTVLKAMRAGAIDFLEKPYTGERLVASVRHALRIGLEKRATQSEASKAVEMLSLLTPRERDVLEKIASGRSNKVAAHELGISPRTVECHRASVMQKLRASGLHELVRMVQAAKKAASDRAGASVSHAA